MDYVYAKFLKSKLPHRRKFRISTDKNYVENFDIGDRQNLNDVKNSEDKRFSKFYFINEEIFDTFLALYDLVPILVSVTSLYPNAILENDVLNPIRKHGEVIEDSEEYELYRISAGSFRYAHVGLKRMSSIASLLPYFPRFYIVGLVSLFDHFIFNLAKAVIESRPELVFNSSKEIPYSNICKYDNVEQIRSYVVEKEVENLLRMSHEDQLEWFSKKLGMKISPREKLYADFVEICERRNLFVHTGGYVTEQYLEKCRDAGYDVGGTKVGIRLEAKSSYFKNSVETIIEIAVQLVHVVWQKVDRNGKEASKALINITFNLIRDEKYDLSIRILEFVLNNKSSNMDDATRKMHVINCANAKKLAEKEGYLDLLDSEDWSAVPEDFKICVAAVRDDVDTVVDLMNIVTNAGSIDKEDFRTWPVFKPLEKNKGFSDEFERIFKEPFVMTV
ncbi:MAG: hypothetical protein RIB55_10755 [Nitratireductor sp.]